VADTQLARGWKMTPNNVRVFRARGRAIGPRGQSGTIRVGGRSTAAKFTPNGYKTFKV
jgi:hypothetical protein